MLDRQARSKLWHNEKRNGAPSSQDLINARKIVKESRNNDEAIEKIIERFGIDKGSEIVMTLGI